MLHQGQLQGARDSPLCNFVLERSRNSCVFLPPAVVLFSWISLGTLGIQVSLFLLTVFLKRFRGFKLTLFLFWFSSHWGAPQPLLLRGSPVSSLDRQMLWCSYSIPTVWWVAELLSRWVGTCSFLVCFAAPLCSQCHPHLLQFCIPADELPTPAPSEGGVGAWKAAGVRGTPHSNCVLLHCPSETSAFKMHFIK